VTTPQPDAVSAHQRHVRVPDTPGPEDSLSLVNRVQVKAVRWPKVGRDEWWRDMAKVFDGGT